MMQPDTAEEGRGVSRARGAKGSRLPLGRDFWEEGERRKADEEREKRERLLEQRKLQEKRVDQWYLPKELIPTKGDNFSLLRSLQEHAGRETKANLDSPEKTDVDPIRPSAPLPPASNNDHADAVGNVEAGGNVEHLRRFQPSVPQSDTQNSLPSYDEAINIT